MTTRKLYLSSKTSEKIKFKELLKRSQSVETKTQACIRIINLLHLFPSSSNRQMFEVAEYLIHSIIPKISRNLPSPIESEGDQSSDTSLSESEKESASKELQLLLLVDQLMELSECKRISFTGNQQRQLQIWRKQTKGIVDQYQHLSTLLHLSMEATPREEDGSIDFLEQKINSFSLSPILHQLIRRQDQIKQECPQCNKKRTIYCPVCFEFVVQPEMMDPSTDLKWPSVQLPVNIHIIRHPECGNSNSTSLHAKLLSPRQVFFYRLTDLPRVAKPISSIPDSVTETKKMQMMREKAKRYGFTPSILSKPSIVVSDPVNTTSLPQTESQVGESTQDDTPPPPQRDGSSRRRRDSWKTIPSFPQASSLVLFPDEQSIFSWQLLERLIDGNQQNLQEETWDVPKISLPTDVILLECTWGQQTAELLALPQLTALTRLKLSPEIRTMYWKDQHLGLGCVCSIEALYFAMKELSLIADLACSPSLSNSNLPSRPTDWQQIMKEGSELQPSEKQSCFDNMLLLFFFDLHRVRHTLHTRGGTDPLQWRPT